MCFFFKCAFFLPTSVLTKLERLRLISRRENFFTASPWLTRVMEKEIIWEVNSGLVRFLPFGVCLLCLGRRSPVGSDESR